jgi:hypothetical protein
MYPELTISCKEGEYKEYVTLEAVKAFGFVPVDLVMEHCKYEYPNAKMKEPVVTILHNAHLVRVTIPWYEVIYS